MNKPFSKGRAAQGYLAILFFLLLLYNLFLECMSLCVLACAFVMYVVYVCGGHGAICRSRFSPSTAWGLGFKLGLSVRLGGLRTLNHLAGPLHPDL